MYSLPTETLFWLAAFGPLQRIYGYQRERMLANKRYNLYLIKNKVSTGRRKLCVPSSPTVSPAQTPTCPLNALPGTLCCKRRSWASVKQNWVLCRWKRSENNSSQTTCSTMPAAVSSMRPHSCQLLFLTSGVWMVLEAYCYSLELISNSHTQQAVVNPSHDTRTTRPEEAAENRGKEEFRSLRLYSSFNFPLFNSRPSICKLLQEKRQGSQQKAPSHPVPVQQFQFTLSTRQHLCTLQSFTA